MSCICTFSSFRSLRQGSANARVLAVAETGGHRKWVRRSSFLRAKRLYEDAQMPQKVKQYLSNLELEMDEKSLRTLSLQCEPATNACEFFLETVADSDWNVGLCPVQRRGWWQDKDLFREGSCRSSSALAFPLCLMRLLCSVELVHGGQHCGLTQVALVSFRHNWYSFRGHMGRCSSNLHSLFSYQDTPKAMGNLRGWGLPGQRSTELDAVLCLWHPQSR